MGLNIAWRYKTSGESAEGYGRQALTLLYDQRSAPTNHPGPFLTPAGNVPPRYYSARWLCNSPWVRGSLLLQGINYVFYLLQINYKLKVDGRKQRTAWERWCSHPKQSGKVCGWQVKFGLKPFFFWTNSVIID